MSGALETLVPRVCRVLAGNNLTGELPRHWAGLLKLQVLDAGDNELSGALPGQWETLQALQVLKLAGNQLSVRWLARARTQALGTQCLC